MSTEFNSLTLYKLLKSSQLFRNVGEQDLQHVIHNTHRIRCGKSEFINTDQKNYCYLIEKGSIVLSRVTHDGDTYIVDIISRGSLFGISNVFVESIESQMLAKASETSFLWRIPIYILRDLMEKDTVFGRNILLVTLKTRVAQDNEMEHHFFQIASQRIACFLLHHFGEIIESPAVVELPHTKNLIAKKLGIKPETFSRALQDINKKTGTEFTGSKVVIKDIDRLKSFTCHSCSLEYPCENHISKDRVY